MFDLRFVLKFPDRETALAVAAAISEVPDLEAFPHDGVLSAPHGRYAIHDIGLVFDVVDEEPVARDAYYIGGHWSSSTDDIPVELIEFITDDEVPWWWDHGERHFG